MKVAVGSMNPIKIAAVEACLSRFWPSLAVIGVAASSGVSAQPMSDAETIRGAIQRAKAALAETVEEGAVYGIGLEGGVQETEYGLFLCNWGAVVDREGRCSVGGGLRICLPEVIARRIRQGGYTSSP